MFRRIWGPDDLPTTTIELFTVPAGHVYLIRGIQHINHDVSQSGRVRLYLNGILESRLIAQTAPIAAGDTLGDRLFISLNEGDILYGRGSINNLATLISGVDQTIP
jgi:hypothetical protein